jgi:hypothetical protein
MATFERRSEEIEKAQTLLAELAPIEPASLARTEDLSRDINFSAAVPYFEDMLEVVKQLSDRDISRLGHPQLVQIVAGCSQLTSLIAQVNNFTMNQNTPADVCNGIIKSIRDAYDLVMEPLTIPLAFTATQSTDYAKIEREAKGYHSTMKEEADKFVSMIEGYRADAEKALSAVKEQAAEAGVSTNAQIFLADSSTHSSVAKKWLIATIVVSVSTFILAGGFVALSFFYTPPSTEATIQYVVSKIILLSTLSFAIYWCAQNYKSQKHNETSNKHRANALMTFRAFIEGADDTRIKDAVLMHAAQAAFSNRKTGYDGGGDDTPTINPVVEILGKAMDSAPGA